MATFKITVVNETFTSTNDQDLPSLDAAKVQGLRAALQIGTEEVVGGKPFFAAEITVEAANQIVGRYVVSVGASPLIVAG